MSVFVHLGEKLQDLVDNRLSGAELEKARSHLDACAHCRRELEALRRVKQELAPQPVPERLRQAQREALARLLDEEDRGANMPMPRRTRKPAAWRWALAAGIVLIVASGLLLWPRGTGVAPDTWTAAVASDFRAYRGAQLPLSVHTGDPAELERFFAGQNLGFHTRVYDLAGMDYRIQGGSVHRLHGRTSALFAYRGPQDSSLLCEMFPGRMNELPAASQTLSHNGTTFHVYHAGTLTAVFWPEGKILCVLVSDIDSKSVIALAFAKATPAA